MNYWLSKVQPSTDWNQCRQTHFSLIISFIAGLKKKVCYCLTSEVDGDPVNGVLLTEADCPVGMSVTLSCVDTVVFDVVCVCIIIDGCAAVIVIIFIHWRHAAFFTKSNIFCRQNYVCIYKISLILYSLKSLRYVTQRGGDSSVVRAPDSWLKGRGFESLL